MVEAEIARRYRQRGYWLPETLAGRLERVCREAAGRVALVDGRHRLTFGEARLLVERLAGHLHGLGVGPGDVVSWQLPNWWEAAIVHHAALRLGALPNPLNEIFRARELRFVLAEARPSALVVPRTHRQFDHATLALRLRDEIPGLRAVIVARGTAPGAIELDALLAEPAPRSAPALAPSGDASHHALLLYTSGTTSDPKGVLHSHETLLYEIGSLERVHAITHEDRYLGGSPVTHIAGLVYGVLMPFALGTSTAFLERWDAGAALELIERERVTFQTGAPTFLQTLAERAGVTGPSSFRLFSTGGANISAEMVRKAEARLGCIVKRAYGSTEAPTLTATAMDDPAGARLETDGRAVGAAELRIVRDGATAAPGEEGEIWARSPEVFLGYRNPALTAECFEPDGWYRTGDLGTIDRKGFLRVTGRLGDIIIRGGENISAAEIESLIGAHPAVAEVAVVGMPDPVLGERAVAFVVPRPGVPITFESITEHLDGLQIARQKFPERLEIRRRLPRTASGKVAKAALRAELARAAGRDDAGDPG